MMYVYVIFFFQGSLNFRLFVSIFLIVSIKDMFLFDFICYLYSYQFTSSKGFMILFIWC